MKKDQGNKGSRRKFFAKTGQAAVGAVLTGCATPANVNIGSKTASKSAFGAGGQKPHPPRSKFVGERRMPGFLPNMTQASKHCLFFEEALTEPAPHQFCHFPVPTFNKVDFQEPKATDTSEVWNEFNKWILGYPFSKGASDSKPEFDDLIENILNAARNYNVALYWMRRLHFHETRAKAFNGISMPFPFPPIILPVPYNAQYAPPPNLNGDADHARELPLDYEQMIGPAQDKWDAAVKRLNDILQPNSSFKEVWTDMVQVNDYIVSVRIVARTEPLPTVSTKGLVGVFEVGGSLSSHISVSSAFSSP